AVLPFVNLSGADDAYVADSVTEELIDKLSMTSGLRVRPRGVTARYAGRGTDAREVGRELDVQVVCSGSVVKRDERLVVTVRLVCVSDGFQLWAKRFDRRAEDFFAVTDEATHAIADALLAKCAPAPRRRPADPLALELYL